MRCAEPTCDLLLRVRGTVQGVGFRPFVHRLASRLGLTGWVRNDSSGVLIRLAGPAEKVEAFEGALRTELPPAAHLLVIAEEAPDPTLPGAGTEFTIIESVSAGPVEPSLPPDLVICAACRAELSNPADRRFRYPFINCTQCGPRYSIVEALPYDRPKTTMRAFRMCPECQAEYDDPSSRRFHAQPNACPRCGPHVALTVGDGHELARDSTAIEQAAGRIAAGQIVAVKGVGGYHLLADATNENVVAELRRRKHRDEKPLAVMFPNLAAIEAVAEVSDDAARLLSSVAAPIVLVPRYAGCGLAHGVAPGNPWVGAFLAYAPLHILVLQAVGRPVVATSANLAEEPLCIDDTEAHMRLRGIADAFLDHDRPIAHPVDDSVVRVSRCGPVLLRRARGYAPTPLALPQTIQESWLCVGAQMKNAIAVAVGDRVVLSPHIGDLGGAATSEVFQSTGKMLGALHARTFTAVACDKHPDYTSTRYAERLGLPVVSVQHHLAHILACLLEHGRDADDVLGVCWDGTGYGEDGTIWGGEFLLLRERSALRFGRLRPFRLLGGDSAAREPRRVALALLHGIDQYGWRGRGEGLGFLPGELDVFRTMIGREINAPLSSSVGRLFDGIGALLGLGTRNCFEGQVPLAVEATAVAPPHGMTPALSLSVRDLRAGSGAQCELDWRPLLADVLEREGSNVGRGELAFAFHRALAKSVVDVARRAGVGTIALSGGCFQNALLLDLTVEALRAERFEVLTHRHLPPNDGNIAVGQALAALWNLTTVSLP